jgi:hypothetical protein
MHYRPWRNFSAKPTMNRGKSRKNRDNQKLAEETEGTDYGELVFVPSFSRNFAGQKTKDK